MTRLAAAVRHRLVPVLAMVAVVLLGPAAPAEAHFGGGPTVSNYDGRVTSISADLPGVTVRVVDAGERVELTNHSSTPVIVYGYDHDAGTTNDPYLKITADGVWANRNSTATYLNKTRYGTGPVPDGAGAEAEPKWVKESDDPTYRWHDHRTHWMSETDPPQVADQPDQRHVIIPDWQLRLGYGDEEVTVHGTLVWTPPPPAWPWWVGVVVLGALGVVAGAVRAWKPLVLAGVALVAAADVVHLVTSPFPDDPTQGSRSFAIVAAGLPTLVIVVVGWFVLRGVRRGSRWTAYPLAIVGCVAAVQGLSDLSVLWNSNLPQSGPDLLTRAVIVLTTGLGAGLALGAVGLNRRLAAAAPRVDADGDHEANDGHTVVDGSRS